ncbi:MAG TPA: 30S ribosomal protein S17 [bacterium]|jgi:small subunit ribosomal protein S17|nr:30S ribosomal protein S17 [bacterium]
MTEAKIVKKDRSFEGLVVSDKMDKTVVVLVETFKMHPIYKKRVKVSKRYKVHSENNEAKVGNVVRFVECRPLSKDKRWRLVEIVR